MDTTTPGTPAPAEQAPTSTQQIVEQSKPQVTPPAQPGAQPNQVAQKPEYTPEQVAQWRTQAEDAEKYKKQYDALLPEYTKSRQYIAQQLGVQQTQQAQDPYAELVAMAEKEGFDKDSARAVAKMADMIAQSRTNSALQQFQYQNAGNQLPVILSQAYSQAPQALQNQKVADAVKAELVEAINAGQFNLLTPEYAANRAKIIAFDQGVFVQGMQETPKQQTSPNISSMWGIPNGFSQAPRQEAPKPLTPLQEQQNQDLAARYKGATIK